MTTIAVIDPFPQNLNPVIRSVGRPGWELVLASEADGPLTEVVREADVLWAGATATTAALLAAGPKLRFLQKLGAGVDNVAMDTVRERGIVVARLAGVNGETVAEHVIMLLLAVYRRLPVVDRRVRAGEWFKEEARGIHREIRGKTVGIVGMGYAGRALATRLGAFGARVIYSDPVRAPVPLEYELGLEFVDLDHLISRADVISLHAPLMDTTRNMINAERIAAMKPDAVVINCARGGLVDEAALAEALRNGRILGAGIDCFASEPPGQSELFALDNVIVTSHIAGTTLDNFGYMMGRAASNTEAFLTGRPMPPQDTVYLPERTTT